MTRPELGRRNAVRRTLGLKSHSRYFANVGRHHPDYGRTPQEHAFAKAAR